MITIEQFKCMQVAIDDVTKDLPIKIWLELKKLEIYNLLSIEMVLYSSKKNTYPTEENAICNVAIAISPNEKIDKVRPLVADAIQILMEHFGRSLKEKFNMGFS